MLRFSGMCNGSLRRVDMSSGGARPKEPPWRRRSGGRFWIR